MTMKPVPASRISAMIARITSMIAGLTPHVGSSSNATTGFASSNLAKSINLRWPPDRRSYRPVGNRSEADASQSLNSLRLSGGSVYITHQPGYCNILHGCQFCERTAVLIAAEQPPALVCFGLQPCNVRAAKRDRSATRPKLTRNEIKERRLACTVGPNQRHQFGRLQAEINVVNDMIAAEGFLEPHGFENDFRPPPAPSCQRGRPVEAKARRSSTRNHRHRCNR